MSRPSQRGYVMFEAMISILVVSVGLIGLTGMQVRGMTSVNDSMHRSKAVYLAYQMADRVRANIPGAAAGAYNAMTGSVSNPGCASVACTPAQMALVDFADWSAEVVALMPSGSGAVCIDSTPDDGTSAAPACDGVGQTFVVKVWWTELSGSPGATTPTEHRFSTAFRP